jgi:hypothetical protein
MFPECSLNVHEQVAVLDKAKDKGTRILVSAYTNIAVDRVLTGLLDRGFTDLVRLICFLNVPRIFLKCYLNVP